MSRPRTRADKVAIRPTPNLTTLSDSLLRCCAGRRLRSQTPTRVPARMKQRQISATIIGFRIKRLSFGFRALTSNYWRYADGAMRQLEYGPGCRIECPECTRLNFVNCKPPTLSNSQALSFRSTRAFSQNYATPFLKHCSQREFSAMEISRSMLAGASLLALSCVSALAQQVTGVPGSPGATTTIDGKQLPPLPPKFGGVIKEKASESTPWWAPRVVPPKGAPNVLLIMTDDCGFGAPSTFGGVIPTPALDRIAKNGLRYTQFHSTALCSPTRAALITGRNHHTAGYGVVGEAATGFPGYDSVIKKDCGTIGEILKQNGYSTSWFGKDHNTPFYQASQAGPFDQWPTGMGFDYFYGFVGGDTSQWEPNLFRNTTAIYPFAGQEGKWNLTTAMADDAIAYMKQLSEIAPDKPFFVYYVPGGTHAPHHPTPEWTQKISDMHLFDGGWNKMRDTIFDNQRRLGIVPADAKLTAWPKDLPEWDSLSLDEKKLFIKQADVYGAYLAYTDHEIGRVIQGVEDMGELNNTLIIYISGDNGASSEGMLNGTPNEWTTFNGVAVPVKDQFLWYEFWGSDKTFPHFAAGWAWAMDTPFKWVKQVASHRGGTANGMAMSWPGHITDVGGIRRQFHHVIDIVPTILEATGIPAPDTIKGIKQRPIEGVSMVYTLDKANANAPSKHSTQYFEMLGNRAIYHDGWVAATTPVTTPWELSSAPPPDVITGYK